MADAGLFTSWGENITGRESVGLEVFEETIAFWQRHKDAGLIESYEVAILGPSGGDLDGFIFARGSADALEEIRDSEEFQRMLVRGSLVVHHLRVMPARINGGLAQGVDMYRRELQSVAV